MDGFPVTFVTIGVGVEKGFVVAPDGADEAKVLKVLKRSATCYAVDANTIKVEPRTERLSHGFIHDLYALIPDGREALVKGWYI